METEYPGLPENLLQIQLIRKMAKDKHVDAEILSPHWVEHFSPIFRELWEAGERDVEVIEKKLYTRDPLGTGYADMIATILIGKPSPRIP